MLYFRYSSVEKVHYTLRILEVAISTSQPFTSVKKTSALSATAKMASPVTATPKSGLPSGASNENKKLQIMVIHCSICVGIAILFFLF